MRIRGGFDAERHKALVSEIREDVDQIRDLTKGAVELEQVRQERASSAVSSYWETFREHSWQLCLALCAMWPQTCSSHIHRANLPLFTPGSKSNGDKEINLSLSHTDLSTPGPLEKSWWEMAVHPFQGSTAQYVLPRHSRWTLLTPPLKDSTPKGQFSSSTKIR